MGGTTLVSARFVMQRDRQMTERLWAVNSFERKERLRERTNVQPTFPSRTGYDHRRSEMNPEKQQEILSALRSKQALGPCPVCQKPTRVVQPEYAGLLFSKTATFEIPGPVATCAIVECLNCGFITTHNISRLGVQA